MIQEAVGRRERGIGLEKDLDPGLKLGSSELCCPQAVVYNNSINCKEISSMSV